MLPDFMIFPAEFECNIEYLHCFFEFPMPQYLNRDIAVKSCNCILDDLFSVTVARSVLQNMQQIFNASLVLA